MRDYVNSAALQEYTTKLVAKLKTLFPGTPTAVATVAEMTDHNKTYVYVGTETGYTAGDWYYWDGSAWTSGGPFQATAIITDTTLTVAGEAADAKATGDAIAAAKAAVLNAMAPAYSTSATYAAGEYVNYNGAIYRCTTAISTAEAWTAGHWAAVTLGADLEAQVSDLKTQLTEKTSEKIDKESYYSPTLESGNITITDNNLVYNTDTTVCRLPENKVLIGYTGAVIELVDKVNYRIRGRRSQTNDKWNSLNSGNWVDTDLTLGNNYKYVFDIRRTDWGTLSAAEAAAAVRVKYPISNLDKYDLTYEKNISLSDLLTLPIYFIVGKGGVSTSGSGIHSSPFIRVKAGQTIYYSLTAASGDYKICIFDDTYSFVSGISDSGEGSLTFENDGYIRVSKADANDGYLYFNYDVPDRTQAEIDKNVKSIENNVGTNSVITGWVNGKQINVGGSTVQTPSSQTGRRYVQVACLPGDTFKVNVSGLSAYRAWAFADTNGNVLTRSAASVTLTNTVIEAPEGAVYLYLNDTDPGGTSYSGTFLEHAVNSIDTYLDTRDESAMYALPDTWKNKIQSIQNDAGTKFTFGVQTDVHFNVATMSGNVDAMNNMSKLTEYIGFDFVCNLGDLISGAGASTPTDSMLATITEMMHRYATNLKSPLFVIPGNHDTNSDYASSESDPTLQINKDQMYARIIPFVKNSAPNTVFNGRSLYYYHDFEDIGIRAIFLNTTDGDYTGDTIGSTYTISNAQITWLSTIALNTDKKVMIFAHVPLDENNDLSTNTVTGRTATMSAIKSFKTNGGTLIGMFYGHTHKQDSVVDDNGILHVTFNNGGSCIEIVMIDTDTHTIYTKGIGEDAEGNTIADRTFVNAW